MELKVNGSTRQSGNTRYMIFKPAYLVYYLSQFMTLEAGDLISTGTPAGVALGMTPPAYLKKGDVAELSIDGLGTQRQLFI
jgi:2-keto-4-pentenoate hydratase/2-oxohepta-3-ene-1,7-dioic acid hydratase in catechol pathway